MKKKDALFVGKHYSFHNLTKILGLMWRKGIGIIPNFASMSRTKKLLAFYGYENVVAQVKGLAREKARTVV